MRSPINFLNAETMTPLSSSCANYVSSIRCPHPRTKSRSSFSLTASATQSSLHTVLLLGDFYKKSQSRILSDFRAWGNGHWALGNGHWAMGNGQWALGNGHWALGIGHWALGIKDARFLIRVVYLIGFFLCPMLYAQCPMPNAPFPN